MATSHHKRSMAAAAKAVIKPGNYSGVLKTLLQCSAPLDFLSRYVRNRGQYPADFRIRSRWAR